MLKLGRKNKVIVKAEPEKEKRMISSKKVTQNKVITNKNNCFAPNHSGDVNGQEILKLVVDQFHL